MLAARLAERGVSTTSGALEGAGIAAWRRYDDLVRSGGASHPWKALMDVWLDGAGIADGRDALVDWLWLEQPGRNLWRRPIAGMIDVVGDLRAAGLKVGVISNSE